MYTSRFIVVAVAGGLVLSLASCRTSRPESLAGWGGCLARDHSLEKQEESEGPSLEVVSGSEGFVLLLRAHWDESLFSPEYSWGSLRLMLGSDLQPDLTITLDGKHHGMYREGDQVLLFNTVEVVGTVLVKELGEEEVVLVLDLVARGEKNPGDDERVTQELKGEVRAEIVKEMEECPAP
jgi:hypothetical protein